MRSRDADEWARGGLSNQSTQFTTHESNQLRGLGRAGPAGGGCAASSGALNGWEISSESVMQKIEESQKRQENEEKNYIIDDAEMELEKVLEGDDLIFNSFEKSGARPSRGDRAKPPISRNTKSHAQRNSDYATMPVSTIASFYDVGEKERGDCW